TSVRGYHQTHTRSVQSLRERSLASLFISYSTHLRSDKMSGNRKHHRLATIALILLLAASCLLEQVDGKKSRGSKRSSRRQTKINIEIYHPKGVIIWYPYSAGIEEFSIEIFINKANQQTSDEYASSAECDICLSTTEVSYGKFILRSADAEIRAADHLYYNAIIKKNGGQKFTSRSNEFYVSASRILMGNMAGGSSSCDTAVAPLPEEDQQQLDEIKMLEDILSELDDQCRAGQKSRTKQLLLNAETPTRYNAKQLYEYAASVLGQQMPAINWNRTLVDAFYASNGIGFEVSTTVEKLKVLKLAKALPSGSIVDLDTLPTDDSSNEIDSIF
uniref:CBM39 domain-containing protein n=1 Tax=Anopheles dirus TaxID=7168 RepID=A0A182NF17_9DIPT